MTDPTAILDQIERDHEKARREQIRVLSAQAYVPRGWVGRLIDRLRRRF